jgi:hypothetical protein
VEINCTWETIRGNIKISAKESLGYVGLKKHKPWFEKDAETYQVRGKAKLQWLQDPSEVPYILESNPHLVFATFLNEKS